MLIFWFTWNAIIFAFASSVISILWSACIDRLDKRIVKILGKEPFYFHHLKKNASKFILVYHSPTN